MKTSKKNGIVTIVEKREAGMGIAQMKEWALKFIQSGARVLILDGLSAHENDDVRDIFESNGVKVFITPPQCGKLINPCDNSFFSTFKSHIARKNTSTTQLKEQAVIEVSSTLKGSIVKNAWGHSGWTVSKED